MKILFLTAIILTSAVVQGEQTAEEAANTLPCQDRAAFSQYKDFVYEHIISKKFDRHDEEKWERYLDSEGLCGREQVQSFIDTSVKTIDQICGSTSRRVIGDPVGNRCISQSNMHVYDVESWVQQGKCNVVQVNARNGPVVVACDKVGRNLCRPVHYERYTGQQRANLPCS